MNNGKNITPHGKISIIVPVYNVEEFLAECIESLINQTYSDLEILLVDDGSKDSSGKIADDYALKDSRIKVIHKPNGGVSSARNEALRACTGEYILFVDSDDWIKKDTCERVLRTMQANDADVCFYNLIMAPRGEKNYLRRPTAPEGVADQRVLIREILQNYFMCINNKCFHRSAVTVDGKISEFTLGMRILEDGVWLTSVFHLWKKGVMIKDGLGYRRLWEGSAMGDVAKRHQTDIEYLRNFRSIIAKFDAYGEKISNIAKDHFMDYAIAALKRSTKRADRVWLKAIAEEMRAVDVDYSVYVFANIYNELNECKQNAAKSEQNAVNDQSNSKTDGGIKKVVKKLVPGPVKRALKRFR